MSEDRVVSALCNPLVLRGAWLRIDAWYRSGNLAPQPELELWRLHPEAELRKLGAELRTGGWKPTVWQQIPYPKKGARLRHYVLPTVRDQVAFMAHMVLLGPLLDSCVANFAFGNRWYRPIVWDRRKDRPRWEFRPYPLLTNRSYRAYASSHGLYRRVANWTVARMTESPLAKEDYSGAVHHPTDYSSDTLPPWVRESWWPNDGPARRQAAWATLDVELAYPSVQLNRLMRSGIDMLDGFEGLLSRMVIGYTQPVREVLVDAECRREIMRSLVEGLKKVDIDDAGIPRDAWRPYHAAPRLPPNNQGLPTGLAVSGMLLNVALYDTDRSVLKYLEERPAEHRGAFIRFADDMVVLSRSSHGLMDLIEAVWRGLADDKDATLAIPQSASNLYLGFQKISPKPVRKLMRRYLCSQGWTKCGTAGCDDLELRRNPRNPVALAAWWTDGDGDSADGEIGSLRRGIDRSIIRAGQVGPFVTTLVARLSDIARDTLSERFGEGARNRLIQLHDLARLDIEDLQVRADTRRAFAVNRLVRAWLPGGHDEVATALSEIRDSIGYVLHAAPWKYSLWRAVVRAGARRPPDGTEKTKNDDVAGAWLSAQLRRIAHHTTQPSDPTSWAQNWPEEGAGNGHDRHSAWRTLYLSFHRTAFWQALADVLRALWQHEFRLRRSHAGNAGPPPWWWIVRAVPEGGHSGVREFLSALDQWVDILYPSETPPDLTAWSWELDQLVAATIASQPALQVAEAWRRCVRPDECLMVPERLSSPAVERTMAILRYCDRVSPRRTWPHYLNELALAHVRLAGRDEGLGQLLFPRGKRPRIVGSKSDLTHTLMMGVALGCSEDVDRDLAAAVLQATGGVQNAHRDSSTLREYGSARRIVLGSGKLR